MIRLAAEVARKCIQRTLMGPPQLVAQPAPAVQKFRRPLGTAEKVMT